MIIGIDPGLTGAIALMDGEICRGVWDMPVSAKTYGKGRQVNGRLLADLLDEIADPLSRPSVLIEQVGSMPGQGVASMFSFGHSAGLCEGVCAALGLRYGYVLPQAWKRLYRLTGREKDAARTEAIRLYPEIAHELARKKDIGRADAVLIAGYGVAQ